MAGSFHGRYQWRMNHSSRPPTPLLSTRPGLRREIVLAVLLTVSAIGFSVVALVATLSQGPTPAEHAPLR
jgi:hypothetical protein